MARSYRRNGTPIGDRRVYVVTTKKRPCSVYEMSGVTTWEEADASFELMRGMYQFGDDSMRDDLALVRPGADLTQANLEDANLERADLSGAILCGVNFCIADLTEARLCRANFTDAYLEEAVFCGADFTGADLTGARLMMAHLEDSDLTRVVFTGTDIKYVEFEGAIYPTGTVPPGWKRYTDPKGVVRLTSA